MIYLSKNFEKVYDDHMKLGCRILVIAQTTPTIAVQNLLLTNNVKDMFHYIQPPKYLESTLDNSRVVCIGDRQDEIDRCRKSRFDVIIVKDFLDLNQKELSSLHEKIHVYIVNTK